jgi:hypothetical protein
MMRTVRDQVVFCRLCASSAAEVADRLSAEWHRAEVAERKLNELARPARRGAACAVEIAALRAERDALKAGKWAGPWNSQGRRSAISGAVRCIPGGTEAAEVYPVYGGGWSWYAPGSSGQGEPSEEAARAAADVASRAAGWWLA